MKKRSLVTSVKKIFSIICLLLVILAVISNLELQLTNNQKSETSFTFLTESNDKLDEINFTEERTNWNLTQIGLYPDYYAERLCLVNNIMYVLDSRYLNIVNVTRPWDPELISIYDTHTRSEDIKCYNDYLYITSPYNGLEIIDVINKSNPTQITTYKDNPEARYTGLVIKGNYIYIFDTNYGFKILDQRYLPTITLEGSIWFSEMGDGINKLCILDNYAYFGSRDAIHIININNPLNPYIICNYTDYSNSIDSVIVRNNLLYFTSYDGFFIVDVTNKYNPTLRDDYGLSSGWIFFDLKLNGTEAFIIDRRSSAYNLEIFDISNPDEIKKIYTYDTEYSFSTSIMVYGCCIYIFINYAPLELISYDYDMDRLADKIEIEVYNTNPQNPDTDQDLMDDYYEVYYTLDPLNSTDANDDNDLDELTNLEEYNYNTNPINNDTDNDNVNDSAEIFVYFTDPTYGDTDYDQISDGHEIFIYGTDPLKPDTDDDQLPDYDEIFTHRTDPTNRDTDGDLIPDYDEIFTYSTDPNHVDTDRDGLSDYE
ncbi:MAG: hypothetical protein FK733_17710, partial [Asgard group archaeon]|nr:hypothetical protein [Asgard group archaeon]